MSTPRAESSSVIPVWLLQHRADGGGIERLGGQRRGERLLLAAQRLARADPVAAGFRAARGRGRGGRARATHGRSARARRPASGGGGPFSTRAADQPRPPTRLRPSDATSAHLIQRRRRGAAGVAHAQPSTEARSKKAPTGSAVLSTAVGARAAATCRRGRASPARPSQKPDRGAGAERGEAAPAAERHREREPAGAGRGPAPAARAARRAARPRPHRRGSPRAARCAAPRPRPARRRRTARARPRPRRGLGVIAVSSISCPQPSLNPSSARRGASRAASSRRAARQQALHRLDADPEDRRDLGVGPLLEVRGARSRAAAGRAAPRAPPAVPPPGRAPRAAAARPAPRRRSPAPRRSRARAGGAAGRCRDCSPPGRARCRAPPGPASQSGAILQSLSIASCVTSSASAALAQHPPRQREDPRRVPRGQRPRRGLVAARVAREQRGVGKLRLGVRARSSSPRLWPLRAPPSPAESAARGPGLARTPRVIARRLRQSGRGRSVGPGPSRAAWPSVHAVPASGRAALHPWPAVVLRLAAWHRPRPARSRRRGRSSTKARRMFTRRSASADDLDLAGLGGAHQRQQPVGQALRPGSAAKTSPARRAARAWRR